MTCIHWIHGHPLTLNAFAVALLVAFLVMGKGVCVCVCGAALAFCSVSSVNSKIKASASSAAAETPLPPAELVSAGSLCMAREVFAQPMRRWLCLKYEVRRSTTKYDEVRRSRGVAREATWSSKVLTCCSLFWAKQYYHVLPVSSWCSGTTRWKPLT